MLKAYYIAEVEDRNVIDQLKFMGLEVNTSKRIERPSNKSLLPIWTKAILETELDRIEKSDFVILDGGMNDRFRYYLMLGIAIGKNSYKGSINVLNDEFISELLEDIYLHRDPENPMSIPSIQVDSMDQTYYNQGLITFVANNPVDSVKLSNKIDSNEPVVAILLGICYSRGIIIDYIPENSNLFIDLITNR